MSFLGDIPAKLRAKHDAKAMRKFEAAQAGERPKGLMGMFQNANKTAGTNFSDPKMMADLATQARANMPAPAAAGAPAMGGRFGTSDRGENTKDFKKGGMAKKKKPMAAKKMAKGGSASSASRRADGCATKGKTKGRFV